MLPNHSLFARIEEENFLQCQRLLTTLDKASGHYLNSQFRKDCRQFLKTLSPICSQQLQHFCSLVRALVASALKLLSAEITFPDFFLVGQLLDGQLQRDCIKGSVVEPAEAELQSSVGEQRQLEQHSTRKFPDMGHILTFCVSQAGFRGHQNLNHVRINYEKVLLSEIAGVPLQYALDLSFDCADCGKAQQSILPFVMNLERFAVPAEDMTFLFACKQDSVRRPRFTQMNFLPASGISMFNAAISSASVIGTRASFDLWESVHLRSQTNIITDLKRFRDDQLVGRKSAANTRERVFSQ